MTNGSNLNIYLTPTSAGENTSNIIKLLLTNMWDLWCGKHLHTLGLVTTYTHLKLVAWIVKFPGPFGSGYILDLSRYFYGDQFPPFSTKLWSKSVGYGCLLKPPSVLQLFIQVHLLSQFGPGCIGILDAHVINELLESSTKTAEIYWDFWEKHGETMWQWACGKWMKVGNDNPSHGHFKGEDDWSIDPWNLGIPYFQT